MTDSFLHDFWEASALNHLTVSDFGAKVLAYETNQQDFTTDPLAGSHAAHPLPLRNDRLHKIIQSRRSARSFSDRALSEKELGQILGAVSGHREQRMYPSAGGLGSAEVFALLNRVDSDLGRMAARYLPNQHALTPVSDELPPLTDLDQLLSLEGCDPALILVFAVRLDEVVRKYGARGGRFALIEVGHACQNIALRLAVDGLAGYQLGGTLDHDLEQLMGLGAGRAQVTLGYAIGHPA